MLKSFARRIRSFATRDVTNELASIRSELSAFTASFVASHQDESTKRFEAIDRRLELIMGASDHTRHLTITNLKLLKMQTLGDEPVVSCSYNGMIPIKFFVPKGATDYIQGYQLYYENFWEVELLDKMKSFTKGKAILDVGANVGNHVIYWSRVAGAKSIKAFEPIPELFDILRRNIELNGIHNAEAFEVALGKEKSFGQPVSHGSNRMQSEIFASQDDAGIKIVALDDLDIPEADFVKIDVEGHTLDLLHGGGKTLTRLKPALFVELFQHEKDACITVLDGLGYQMLKALEDNNYFFVHKDRPFDGELGFL